MSAPSSPAPHHTAPRPLTMMVERPAKRPRVHRELTLVLYDTNGVATKRTVVGLDVPHAEPNAGTPLPCKALTCTCLSQAAVMLLSAGRTTPYVWSYKHPAHVAGTFSVIGPQVCLGEVLRFGKDNYKEGIIIHATPDEVLSPHVHEIILDIDNATTHSAYCAKCKCRTTFDGNEGTCHVCDYLLVCPECTESFWSKLGCEACDDANTGASPSPTRAPAL